VFVLANEQVSMSRLDLVAVEPVNLSLVAHSRKRPVKQTLSINFSGCVSAEANLWIIRHACVYCYF
jgi:hypothetical protein